MEDHSHAIPVMRPSLQLKPQMWYNPEDVEKAWDAMLLVGSDVETYR